MLVLIKLKTMLALGAGNLWHVLSYRLRIKLGLISVKGLLDDIEDGDFFLQLRADAVRTLPRNTTWQGQHCYFGWYRPECAETPHWHRNCLSGQTLAGANKAWWKIADFDRVFGDIKTVWEASRFDWVICLMQSACTGNKASLVKLNKWLRHWLSENPPYNGPNWKCGQEVSIRVMHLAMAALLAKQHRTTSVPLQQLVAAHLRRIVPTIRYAMAQDNNHGTSEAAALFIGGSWLQLYGHKDAARWKKLGLKWLENRARRLIEPDGSFSQYSVNYHRVLLDTYSMAEVWRRGLALEPFSNVLYKRLSGAAIWLYQLPGITFGDAPNLGANDGARLLPLTDTDFRDYRPSVQLAAVLFTGKKAYNDKGIWDLPLQWFNIERPAAKLPAGRSVQFDNGGYVVLSRSNAVALMRYPRYRFRPSHADALHLDFWLGGLNILRDGGSFNYSSSMEQLNYFCGTRSHNTIRFDERDQMPKLSRFLFGAWSKTKQVSKLVSREDGDSFSASYKDYLGAYHLRKISLTEKKLTVIDTFSGFKRKAVLSWRVFPAEWKLAGRELTCGSLRLVVTSEIESLSLELTQGCESRYYLKKNKLLVLEVSARSAGVIKTELFF